MTKKEQKNGSTATQITRQSQVNIIMYKPNHGNKKDKLYL